MSRIWVSEARGPAQRLQRVAVDVFHDDVADLGFDAGVVQGHDMRVLEQAGGTRLDEKAALVRAAVAGTGIVQRDLQGDLALDEGIKALEHDAAGAAPDLAEQPVLADLGGRCRPVSRGMLLLAHASRPDVAA